MTATIVVAAILVLSLAFALDSSRGTSSPGCVKPVNGFLIIATNTGYNDSRHHGAPQTPWPVIKVRSGTTVSIVFCNTDNQAHGLAVEGYDPDVGATLPGHVSQITFVASESGTYRIYDTLLSTEHIYTESGELLVTA